MKRLLALAAIITALVFAAPVQAATHVFTVHNRTSVTISSLYLSPTGTQIPWSNDILGTDTLPSGYMKSFQYTDGEGSGDYCTYDVLAKTADGERYGGYVNLCTSSNIYLYDKDRLGD